MRKIFIVMIIILSADLSAYGASQGETKALASAKSYLDAMAFSYNGLIYQLEQYENFSHSEAVYAAENCGADWYEQAARKAKEYLSIMKISRRMLIDHLVSVEGFTQEQAQYGAAWSY